MRGVASALCIALASGCSLITDSFVTNEFSGDEFPIEVDTSSGAIVVGLREDGVPDRIAVLDVLSPLTIADTGATAAQEIRTTTLQILGENGPGGPLDRPRAHLTDAQLVSLHPCKNDVAPCVVGMANASAPYGAIIGADVLAGDAVRLRLGDDQIFLLADVGGDDAHRSRACDAVFPSPYRGGGTIIIAQTEVPFGGRRISLGTCLGPDPSPRLSQAYRGADALFVVSTSIGPSIISESAYLRYIQAHPHYCTDPADPRCPLALAALPAASVNLPSGPIEGRSATLTSLAVVAASSDQRAPCRQVYASHFMAQRDCVGDDDDCPCNSDADDPLSCRTPAILTLAPTGGIGVLVVSDRDTTLQALRTELRPNQPEVDGILGTSALRSAEIDVDYPHNRLLARCPGDGCIARPQLSERADRAAIASCLKYTPPGPDYPLP